MGGEGHVRRDLTQAKVRLVAEVDRASLVQRGGCKLCAGRTGFPVQCLSILAGTLAQQQRCLCCCPMNASSPTLSASTWPNTLQRLIFSRDLQAARSGGALIRLRLQTHNCVGSRCRATAPSAAPVLFCA